MAVVLDTMATLTDETLEMHERTIGREFKKAERRHLDAFQESGKAINEKVRLYAAVGKALIEAKTQAVDPFPEIEKLMPWEAFLASVEEAAKLARPEDFDHLALVGNGYSYIRRYASEFLDAFEFRAVAGQRGVAQGDSSAAGSERQGMPGMYPRMRRPASSVAAGSHTSSRAKRSTAASTNCASCPSCATRCVRATSGSWAAASSETSRSICYRRRPSRR